MSNKLVAVKLGMPSKHLHVAKAAEPAAAEPDDEPTADLDELVDRIVKAGHTTQFMKQADDLFEEALEDFQRGQARFEKSKNLPAGQGINAFTETGEGQMLYTRYLKARDRRIDGPVEIFEKVASDAFDRINTEIVKRVEEFSIQHNLDEQSAHDRLEAISPTFRDLLKAQHKAADDRMRVVEKARDVANAFHVREARAAEAAERDEATTVRKSHERAAMMPSERAIFDLAEKRAEEQGCTVQKAVCDILDTPEGQALRSAADEERAYRHGGE